MRKIGRRGRKPVDPDETAQDRFRRLAEKRLASAIKCMELLQNLSRRAQYAYTDQQARRIVRSLAEGVADVEAAFGRGGPGHRTFETADGRRLYAPRADSGGSRDTRTPRQRLLDRNKQAGRYWPRRMGPGPR